MKQEEIDLENGICTLSKILFFRTAENFGISKEELLLFIQNKKQLSAIESYQYLYAKAFSYGIEGSSSRAELIRFLLE